MSFRRVSAKHLREMEVGETQIFLEAPSKNAGKETQSYASREGLTVETRKCFVVIPFTEEMISALSVTVKRRKLDV